MSSMPSMPPWMPQAIKPVAANGQMIGLNQAAWQCVRPVLLRFDNIPRLDCAVGPPRQDVKESGHR